MYFPRIPTGLRWLLDSDTYGNDLSWFITVPEKVRFTELLLRAEFLGVSPDEVFGSFRSLYSSYSLCLGLWSFNR